MGEFNRKKEGKKERKKEGKEKDYLPVVNYRIFELSCVDRKRICTTFKMSYKY